MKIMVVFAHIVRIIILVFFYSFKTQLFLELKRISSRVFGVQKNDCFVQKKRSGDFFSYDI
ncbi:MAG: hypothetical protein ACJAYN_001382 [Bermanella sp.]|jgi:hypothetical protein